MWNSLTVAFLSGLIKVLYIHMAHNYKREYTHTYIYIYIKKHSTVLVMSSFSFLIILKGQKARCPHKLIFICPS
ncbi:unnamed protein product [Phytomonas sp. Hart1]|nr:unnamed protein product [Phytomonas sp. Hart1]|eukprot:CCW66126.1 unnamed protein product [Phytomonas sp. isolate Hart1]